MRKNTPFLIKFTLFFLFFAASVSVHGQYVSAGANVVVSFKPGTGQNSGQTPEYFPRNILGLPDSSARYQVPSTSPEEICSLGFGGEIILAFQNKILRDGQGKDFTVFENAFYSPDFGRKFVEPARISVSKDGSTYVQFPYDSLTLKGCAGVTPTNGENSPFDPAVSGGDSYDLADIGMDSVRYVKITDISALLLNRKHPLYDPITTGFDLDAIVGLHLQPDDKPRLKVSFGTKTATIEAEQDVEVKCYSLNGALYSSRKMSVSTPLYSLEGLPSGVFALLISAEDDSFHSLFPFIICP